MSRKEKMALFNGGIRGFQAPNSLNNGNLIGIRTADGVGVPSQLIPNLIRRTGANMFAGGDRNVGTRDTFANFAALFKPKHAINNVILINAGPHDTMVTSPLADIYDLSYAVEVHGELRNDITTTITHPAAVKNTHETPHNSTTILNKRYYSDGTRASWFILPAEACEAVLRIQQELTSPRVDYGEETDPVAMDNIRAAYALERMQMLQSLFSTNVSLAEESLKLGILMEAISKLRNSAISMALCRATNQLTSAIADRASATADMRPWQRDLELRNTVVKSYMNESLRDTFGLLKDPGFINRLINVGEDYLKNMVTDSKVSGNAYVINSETGTVLPILGYLCVSGHVSSTISTLLSKEIKSGTRVASVPIHLLPEKAFMEDMVGKGKGGSWRLINERETDDVTFGEGSLDGLPIIDFVKSLDTSKVTQLSQLGNHLLGEDRKRMKPWTI